MIIKTNQCHSDAVKAISSWVVLLHLLSSLVTWEETIESSTIHRQNFTICTGTPCSWFVMLNSWKDEFLIVSCCGENVGHVANSNSTFHLSEKPQETLGSLALRNSWCFSSGTCAPKRSSMVSPISKLMPCIRSRNYSRYLNHGFGQGFYWSLRACHLAHRTSNSDRRLRLLLKCEVCRKWQRTRGRRAKCCIFVFFVVAVNPHFSCFGEEEEEFMSISC